MRIKLNLEWLAVSLLVAGGLFIFLLAALARPIKAQSVPEKPAPTEGLWAAGKALFERQCAVCHGAAGAGDGSAAYLLNPRPRDFTRNEFRLISTTQMQATDEDLFKAITRGMPGSSMPSWEHLRELDRWALVYYVRYLTKRSGLETDGYIKPDKPEPDWSVIEKAVKMDMDPGTLIHVPPEPPSTPEGIQRGKELFAKACASCHGPLGKGDGLQAMKDTQGYPVRPRDLTAGIFKGSPGSADLYYRIVGGLPGSPMPSYSRALKEEQIWDLIHFIQTLFGPGAGENARLKRFKIPVRKIKGPLSADPLAGHWREVSPVVVTLAPLWWRDERVQVVEVRALRDGESLAIQLSWRDPAEDKTMIAPQSFSDGVAIQFSQDKEPPVFAMGGPGYPVTLWHWKASWQEETREWADIETQYPHTATDWYSTQKNYQHGSPFETAESKTKFHDPMWITGWGAGNPLSDPNRVSSAEEARAQGIGTVTAMRPDIENVEARGVWRDGQWNVVFKRALKTAEKERVIFKPGLPVNVAFAVWDGAHGDRNGQKMVSIWNELVLEE